MQYDERFAEALDSMRDMKQSTIEERQAKWDGLFKLKFLFAHMAIQALTPRHCSIQLRLFGNSKPN